VARQARGSGAHVLGRSSGPSASVFRDAAGGIVTVCWLAPVGDRDLGRSDRFLVDEIRRVTVPIRGLSIPDCRNPTPPSGCYAASAFDGVSSCVVSGGNVGADSGPMWLSRLRRITFDEQRFPFQRTACTVSLVAPGPGLARTDRASRVSPQVLQVICAVVVHPQLRCSRSSGSLPSP
jgi:hypothetical protein